LLKFATIGFFQGAVYGLLAVGLVLVYKGTRVFNFAQGEFGTVAAFITYALFRNAGLNYLLAVILALVCTVLLGLIMERLVIRPLLDAPRLTLIVATVGVALLLIAVELLVNQAEPRQLDPAWPDPTTAAGRPRPIDIFGVSIQRQQILIVLVLGGLAVALWYFFTRTNRGLSILAISQDQMATRVVGISVPATSRLIWGMAALLGGIAGILQAPVAGFFTPGFMTALPGSASLVPAFAAAVLGGFTSLPGAFIGGLLIGIAQNLGVYWIGLKGGVVGSQELTVFAVLLLALLIRPQGLFGKEA
jgi:branched-chain amino acid transport system permease protein